MAKVHFTDEFKRDAVAQIVERGYSAAEVSKRLGVSQHSLYEWKKKFSGAKDAVEDNRDAEIRQLKRHLRKFNGVPKAHFGLFLKECEWRFNNSDPRSQLAMLKQWLKMHLR